MEFIKVNWGYLIFLGFMLYIMLKKGGCCGGHGHGGHNHEDYIDNKGESKKSCCGTEKGKNEEV